MAKSKKSSRFWGFNGFANSPTIVKLFGPLLVISMVAALGYGAYTLINENSSDAANGAKYGPWYYNSGGIGHQAGESIKPKNIPGGFRDTGAKGKVWYAVAAEGARNKYVWYGPGVKLPAGKQYFGCFFYQATWEGESYRYGHAYLDVYDVTRNKIINYYSAEGTLDKSHLSLTGRTKSTGKFGRTCLAFYIPKKAKNNRIELRVRLFDGSVMIKKTKITQVPQKKTQLPNLHLLKNNGNKDNNTILHGFKYN